MTLLALVVAGEAVFGLPFHITRFFRPTMLEVFGFTNTELGTLFSFYGVLAFICYLPGGPIADRFSARRLLTASLVLTGLAGFYLATIPSYRGLSAVFAFFGITTILLFWAALIRATREWGGPGEQGAAFGLLDGGRGLFAAGLASLALVPFNLAFPDDPAFATQAERTGAIQRVIWVYTAATLLSAALVWLVVPEPDVEATADDRKLSFRHVKDALLRPSVWLQAVIVVCAYSAYKGLDDYSLFAVQGYGMNELDGARVSVMAAWIRPVAAVGAGLLADRLRPTRAALLCFSVLLAGYVAFAVAPPRPDTTTLLWANVGVTCAAVFGLRGVYFALMEESEIPAHITGTAVGLISLVGFTPDIFVAPVAGWLLDRSPGPAGHQHFFVFLAGFATLGLAATWALARSEAGATRAAARPGTRSRPAGR